MTEKKQHMRESRPLVGVPGQTLQAIDGIPADLPHSWVMNHRYFTALASVGAAPETTRRKVWVSNSWLSSARRTSCSGGSVQRRSS